MVLKLKKLFCMTNIPLSTFCGVIISDFLWNLYIFKFYKIILTAKKIENINGVTPSVIGTGFQVPTTMLFIFKIISIVDLQ